MVATVKRWFAALLVIECRVGRKATDLWDQQVRLIRAPTAELALAEAIKLGRAENTRYKNRDGEPVTWKFVGLGELAELDVRAIRSGLEVFSTLTRQKCPHVL